MDRGQKCILALAVAAALVCGGCGNDGPVQITIGDPAVAEQLTKDVTLTCGLTDSFTLYGDPSSHRKVYLFGRWTEDPSHAASRRVMGLSGAFFQVTATEDGFCVAKEDGTVLYEETGYQGATNFKFYRLSTSDPDLRLWVVAGPNASPYLVWVLGETPDGMTCYATPDDFAKAGISIEDPGKERLALKVEDGVFSVAKLHMDKLVPAKTAGENGGTFEPAKVDWKEDKAAAMVWDGKGKKFVIGSVPGKKSTGFLDSLFSSKGSVSDNKILELDEKPELERISMEGQDGVWAVALPTSNGKKMRFTAYRDFFRLTSEEDSVAYYTSEPMVNYDSGQFRIAGVKVSDPDTRVWSVRYNSNASTSIDYGYWLIGDYKGVLKIYITPEDMAKAGIPAVSQDFMEGWRPHKLDFHVEDGVMKADMSYQFWPRNQPHSAAYQLLDHTFTIAWDKETQGFAVKDVAAPEVPTKRMWNRDTKSFDWQAMTEEEQKKHEREEVNKRVFGG